MSEEVKEQEEVMEESQAPVVEEEVQEEESQEEEKAEKAKKDPKKDLDEKKIEKDVSCSAMFKVGDEVKIEGVPFEIKEVRGIDIVLKRKDIQ